jgi:HEAT repeat protein
LKQLADPSLPNNVRRDVLRSLEELGPSLVAALERRTAAELQALPPEVYAVVLPEVSPIYQSLERLASSDPRSRRAAASDLAARFEGKRLSELALHRLSALVENETDPIVWQAVMALVASDPRGAARRLAYVAVANASSEVRRRACEYLENHPDRAHLDVLLPMLDDGDLTVAMAAVQAIGAAGIQDPEPLIRLLNAPDRQLRLESAIALAGSRFDAGLAAIERLSHETDLEIRRAAAVAMGEIGDAVFLPRLIELIDDRRDIQLAAMASLAAIAGQDVAHREGAAVLPDEQVRLWKRWYAERTNSRP